MHLIIGDTLLNNFPLAIINMGKPKLELVDHQLTPFIVVSIGILFEKSKLFCTHRPAYITEFREKSDPHQ